MNAHLQPSISAPVSPRPLVTLTKKGAVHTWKWHGEKMTGNKTLELYSPTVAQQHDAALGLLFRALSEHDNTGEVSRRTIEAARQLIQRRRYEIHVITSAEMNSIAPESIGSTNDPDEAKVLAVELSNHQFGVAILDTLTGNIDYGDRKPVSRDEDDED